MAYGKTKRVSMSRQLYGLPAAISRQHGVATWMGVRVT
jgi:hypothetical protein